MSMAASTPWAPEMVNSTNSNSTSSDTSSTAEPVRRGSRRLLVVRHAKADYPDGVSDHDRPLAERGQRDAAALGEWMLNERMVPDVVLCSTALRATETWRLASVALQDAQGVDAPQLYTEAALYDADPDTLLTALRELGGDAHTLALIGHEPGLSMLARTLADPETSDPDELTGLGDKFPTAAAVVLRSRADWADIAFGALVLTRVVVPRS